MGLVYYRMLFTQHRDTMGLETAWPPGRKPRNCADARYLAKVWTARSARARRAAEWYLEHYLKETPYDGRQDPWPENVREVQRVFPGSESWVLSCSDAEGWEPGLTFWATYGWGRYYPGFEHEYVVGGPGQFKWPTFIGMYRRGLEYLVSRGYRVPVHLRDPGDVRVWQSPLAQAIAMGAAYHLGLRGGHWSASHSRGC